MNPWLVTVKERLDAGQAQPWMVHFSSLEGEAVGGLQFETDRARFIGRGRSLRHPAAMDDGSAAQGLRVARTSRRVLRYSVAQFGVSGS